jgi:hypothetical protein
LFRDTCDQLAQLGERCPQLGVAYLDRQERILQLGQDVVPAAHSLDRLVDEALCAC